MGAGSIGVKVPGSKTSHANGLVKREIKQGRSKIVNGVFLKYKERIEKNG